MIKHAFVFLSYIKYLSLSYSNPLVILHQILQRTHQKEQDKSRNKRKEEDTETSPTTSSPKRLSVRPRPPYRASLPMMTPMTKNRTQKASRRVLRPSSIMPDVAMEEEEEEEWGAGTDVTFLFRNPSSSCGTGSKQTVGSKVAWWCNSLRVSKECLI